jgi:hypothetical protein
MTNIDLRAKCVRAPARGPVDPGPQPMATCDAQLWWAGNRGNAERCLHVRLHDGRPPSFTQHDRLHVRATVSLSREGSTND